ncbi:MAG: protein kinase [Anaerolineae bacterium]|nr:protein kinase [Anaerolineae bacterium]MDW8173001.1 protein kinase [Anaerolineae bacterium]
MSLLGTRLNGRYEIRAYLGEGATATVYRGFDTLLGREVALKVLLPHVRDTTRKRFFQEAMAAAQLNHPNIMAIYDRGEDNGRSYLVVELVEGEALTEFIPASPQVVVALGTQIARALDYAHDRDIIHRDIKPANIKVTPEGQVKIMDLGLALPREAKRVTAPGMVIGTPAYISPEQAQGQKLDRRTDIYSLGIVLYEMASGQLPFNADDITALMLQHVQQPPPPISTHVQDFPRALENVILRALEKAVARRWQTARALAEGLEAALPGTAASEDAPTLPNRPEWTKTLQTDRLKRLTPAPRKPAVRVALADDHNLLRRTLATFLESTERFIVVAEASDGESALAQTLATTPDILVLDLNMPGKGGLDILPLIRQKAPTVRVLVLTGRDDDDYIMRALRSGAHGYVLKSTDEQKLVESIDKVLDGEIVLGRGVAEKVVGGLNPKSYQEPLTEQELAILLYVGRGYENEQIAPIFRLTQSDLIEAVASIVTKLKVRDRQAAALKAIRDGMISLEALQNLPEPPRD